MSASVVRSAARSWGSQCSKWTSQEAARQIRTLAPESKIVFVSQESSSEVVQEALNVGVWGYVVKIRVAGDLLAAVDAVLEGRHFVSVGLSIQNLN